MGSLASRYGWAIAALAVLAPSAVGLHATEFVPCHGDGKSFHLVGNTSRGSGGAITFEYVEKRLVWKAAAGKGLIQKGDLASATYYFKANGQKGDVVLTARRHGEMRVEGVELQCYIELMRALSQ